MYTRRSNESGGYDGNTGRKSRSLLEFSRVDAIIFVLDDGNELQIANWNSNCIWDCFCGE